MSEPTSVPPPCKCGCGHLVTWDTKHRGWRQYMPGHYRLDAPYKHEDWLRRQYVEKGLASTEIGAACGVSHQTILRHLERFGISPLAQAVRWELRADPADPACERCGGPMESGNSTGVCFRADGCRTEYKRRHHQRYRQDVASGQREGHLGDRRADASFVYGVHFPAIGILKVGSSSRVTSHVHAARGRIRRRALDSRGAQQIWAAPGHHLEESYLQVNLAFQFPSALQGPNRLSEWFTTGSADAGDLVDLLNATYKTMPARPAWLAVNAEVLPDDLGCHDVS